MLILSNPYARGRAAPVFGDRLSAMYRLSLAQSPSAIQAALPRVASTYEAYNLQRDDAFWTMPPNHTSRHLARFKASLMDGIRVYLEAHAESVAHYDSRNAFLGENIPADTILLNMADKGILSERSAHLLIHAGKALKVVASPRAEKRDGVYRTIMSSFIASQALILGGMVFSLITENQHLGQLLMGAGFISIMTAWAMGTAYDAGR